MSNVIAFKKVNVPHAAGEAFCLQCKHEWVAVAQSGVVQLECPECKTLKGLFKFPFNVQAGEQIRFCNCGNNLFIITPEGHLCPNCGIYQGYE